MGVSHIMLKVKDLASSKAFFTAALAPLGYKVGIEFPGMVAFGVPSTGHFDFWLQSTDGKETQGIHLAFNGNSEEEVKAFYDAALKAGAEDNGPPGIRAHYSDKYYAAFVKDFDGHNIECVHFKGE